MKKTIAITASILLSLLFLYAAINKLIIYPVFLQQLKSYPYISSFANVLAWAVPSMEIIIAALLIYYRTRLVGLFSSFVLMFAFTVFIFLLTYFGAYKSCSCGGVISGLTWNQHMIFNGAFTVLAGIAAYILPTDKKQFQPS